MHDLGLADRLGELGPRVGQRRAHAHDRGVHRAGRDRDVKDALYDLGRLATREPVDPGERRDMRLEPRPERRSGHAGRQRSQRRLATRWTGKTQAPVLEDQRRHRRQLPLLVNHGITNALLIAHEHTATAATPGRRVLEGSGHPLAPGHLAVLALMPRLAARFARQPLHLFARQPPALRTRGRRIRRRRHRRVTRTAPQATLELLNPLTQRTILRPQLANKHHQLVIAWAPYTMPRTRHKRKIPCNTAESCSTPHPLNA